MSEKSFWVDVLFAISLYVSEFKFTLMLHTFNFQKYANLYLSLVVLCSIFPIL